MLIASGLLCLKYPIPEGRVRSDGGTLKQEFVITDQQGNARISFQNDGENRAVVRQENSYYGFGLIMPNSPVTTPADDPNKKLYNGGSEWRNEYADNLPDYYNTFYRNYDAAIGRFVGVDPEVESTESMSTYQYAANNPIMFNDPLGDDTDPWLAQNDAFWARVTSFIGPHHGKNYHDWQDIGRGVHFGDDANIDPDILAATRTGDPAAVEAYGAQYGTSYVWNPWGEPRSLT